MAYLEKENGKIYYEVLGKGDAIVLIRGLGRWSEHWCGWQDELSKYYKVIVMDGRGLGRTTVSLSPFKSMSDLARDVLDILNFEQINSAHIFGVSLGGMIAMQFALDFPDATKSVTVVNSSIGRSGYLRVTPKATKVLLSGSSFSKNVNEKNLQRFYMDLAAVLLSPSAEDHVVSKFAKAWQAIDSKYAKPLKTVAAQLLLAFKWRHWEKLSAIKCPVNVVVSEGDQFVPVGNSYFIHSKIPGSRLVKIPYAGHELHMQTRWHFKENSIFAEDNFSPL